MRRILWNILIRKIFWKYRNTLPQKTDVAHPKMEYHAFADAVFWEDEGLTTCNPDLGNTFRSVIHYRTGLITGDPDSCISSKKDFDLAKRYFPKWIGFDPSRCSYNAELSDRINRIRKVSERRVDKLMKEEELNL